jgi:hypothetical protein
VGTWGLSDTKTADEWRAQFISGSYAYAYVSLAAYTTSLANGTDMGEVGLSTIVTSTNLATPSITTDGGSWTGSDGTSSGDVSDRETKVTGPVKTTEVAGPYLTLSSSSGRWLVTETGYSAILKLNKFAKSSSVQSVASLFTVMDGLGNVTDLTTEDPGYTNMVGDPTYTLTFPSVFPSGQTPDVELPPGTKYQVEVVATNTLGTDNAFSNDVMPIAGLLQTSVITANTLKPGGWNEVAAPLANNFTSISYDGSGRFVAVSSDGIQRSMYSDDGGSSWAVVNMPGENLWSSVAYGNGYFVAVSRNGTPRAAYSSDATSWSGPAGNNTYNIEWYGVAYGAGSFVAVGSDGAMESEDNGASWSQRNYASSGVSGSWKSVVYGTPSTGANAGQGVFVAVSSGTTTMYSLNKGYDWIAGGATTGENFVSVAYNNGIFVAVAENSGSMYSTDGITWTASAADSTSAWRGVTYGGGKFVAVARSGTYRTMHSTDGMSWEYGEAIDSGWNAVVYGGDRYVSVSNDGNTMWSLYGNDSYTELTTVDNTNYNLFSAGDAVVESSGGTPVTSAITNVANANYASTVVAEVGFNSNRGPDKGFDGNTQATGSPTYCQSNTSNRYVQWNASTYGISTATSTLRVWAISSGDDISCTGSTGTITIDATDNVNGNVVPDVGNLTSIRVNNPGGLGGFSGISVDGVLLIDGTTTLTFTNDTNLANFRVGDSWKDAQQVTTTGINKITYVAGAGNVYDSGVLEGDDRVPINPGVSQAYGGNNGNYPKIYDANNTVWEPKFAQSGYPVQDFQTFPESFVSPITRVTADNSNASSSSMGISAYYIGDGASSSQINNDVPYDVFSDVSVVGIDVDNNQITVDGGSWSATNGTGDEAWNQSEVWSAGSTGWTNPTNAFDGESNTYANSNSNSGTDGIFSFSAISGNLKLYVTTDQPDDGTTPRSFTLSDGSALSTDKGYSGGSGAVIDFGTVSNITSITAESGGMIWMVELDGSILVDAGIPGGAETFVTGPTFPAATGTLSAVDSTNSKLTFSETTGRWLVTQSDYDTAKKLNTKVAVPLVLDQGNAAHVALFNAMNTKFTAFPTARQTFIDALRTKIIGLTLTTPELEVLCGTAKTLVKRHVITIANNKFYIDGVLQATLSLKKGTTYIFDQDEATNSGHTLKLYTDANKTTEYTSGVTVIGTPGGATSRTTFVVPSNAPAVLYYQSTAAASMGGQLNIS